MIGGNAAAIKAAPMLDQSLAPAITAAIVVASTERKYE
jgi:hypothetical protein